MKEKIKLFFKNNSKLSYLIITRGSKNVILSTRKKNYIFKVKKIIPTDVTGASDTFISILAIFLKKKFPIEKSIAKAIIAARIVIKKKYTSFINKRDI